MKKLITLILAVVLCVLPLVACGKTEADDNTISVAASSTPHAEILEICKEILAKKGYTLDIRVMDDYIIPNTSTDSGDVDANFFQHQPYLDNFNATRGTKLVSVAKVHFEPYGIYAGKCDNLANLPEGAVIAVPNDATNEARALLLLEANGIIELKEGVGLSATKNDIVKNPKNVEIREMEAALITGVLYDVDCAVINGNYAIAANLRVSDALAAEDSESAAFNTYANILVVKEGNENDPKVQALVEAILSDEVRDFINNTYDKAVVPVF